MKPTNRAYLELHTAVLLWGFTAILGRLIELPALSLVWWRVLLTSLSLVFILRFGKGFQKISRRHLGQYALAGGLTGLHWLTFFGAIKLSNASVALVCMATCAFFTALLEPLMLRSRIKWWELFTGFLIVPGMVLIVENVDVSMRAGIWVGLLSSLLAAVFSILNKKWVNNAEPLNITFIEMTSAWLVLSLIMPFYLWHGAEASLMPSLRDIGLLLILALLCTTLTWVLALRALKHITAFASTLTINLEPVYGISLAWLLLGEHKQLASGFYWGVLVILIVVFSYPFLNRLRRKRAAGAQHLIP